MRIVLVGLLAALVAALSVACSSGDGNGTIIEVSAQDMRFVPDVIEVPRGREVTLTLKNLDANEHDLEVRGLTPAKKAGGGHEAMTGTDGSAVAVHTQANKTASVKFIAETPGMYEVVCTMPGHEQSGMVAKLIVS